MGWQRVHPAFLKTGGNSPATETDLATTQPYYWYAKPAAGAVQGAILKPSGKSAKTTARTINSHSIAMISLRHHQHRAPGIQQWFEALAPVTGSAIDVFSNSLADPPNPPLRNFPNADELLPSLPKC